MHKRAGVSGVGAIRKGGESGGRPGLETGQVQRRWWGRPRVVEGGSGGGVAEAVIFVIFLYSLLDDGVLAIAGPRVVYTRFRKSPITDPHL